MKKNNSLKETCPLGKSVGNCIAICEFAHKWLETGVLGIWAFQGALWCDFHLNSNCSKPLENNPVSIGDLCSIWSIDSYGIVTFYLLL